jgi:ectoine hydroxylase-related dioxygenase (phytanoyl-CoA dioxygenase family)
MPEKIDQWITQEKINFYKENGFVQVDDVITPEELQELRQYAGEAMGLSQGLSVKTDKDGGAYSKVLNQKVNVWRDHGGMAKYSFHPRLATMAMRLCEANGIRFFHDHLLWKMPGDSKPTPWHQDTVKWPMNETGAMSIWIALDDVDERNGCMMFVPKSHEAGKLKNISLVDPIDIFEYVKGTDIEKQQPVTVPLKAGSCTFHDGLTFHYAHSNVTDKPRRVLAIIYMKDGTTYNGSSHLITNGQGLNAGEPLQGPMFPLLAKVSG